MGSAISRTRRPGKSMPSPVLLARLKPFGVLGTRLILDGTVVSTGPSPSSADGVVISDPAGLPYIQSGPSGAGGAAGAIYSFLGIKQDKAFPAPVVDAIKAPADAKFHSYALADSETSVDVIHVVGPDLRGDADAGVAAASREEAVDVLASAYSNVLREFAASGQRVLRLLPISGGIFTGAFIKEVPQLTREAWEKALDAMDGATRDRLVAQTEVHLCIFLEKEYQDFLDAGFLSA